MFLHCVYLHQQSREKSGNELPISQTRSVNLKSKVVRGFLGIIYGRKFATRFEAFSICQITVREQLAFYYTFRIILSKKIIFLFDDVRTQAKSLVLSHTSKQLFVSLKIILYQFQLFWKVLFCLRYVHELRKMQM